MGLDFQGKTLSLRSTHGYNDTVIDCGGTYGPVAVFSPTGRAQVRGPGCLYPFTCAQVLIAIECTCTYRVLP